MGQAITTRRIRLEVPAEHSPRLYVHVLGPRAAAGELAEFIGEQLERYERAEVLHRGRLHWNGRRFARDSFELEPVDPEPVE